MAEGTQRRLAAIVSADVVGYSRLMGVDETGTLEALRAHRSELIDPKIAEPCVSLVGCNANNRLFWGLIIDQVTQLLTKRDLAY